MNNLDENTKLVYLELISKYKKQVIDKKELSNELGISVSCINYRMSKGVSLPPYNKGDGSCGRIGFTIINVAKHLVQNNIKLI